MQFRVELFGQLAGAVFRGFARVAEIRREEDFLEFHGEDLSSMR
jgi:hypothetical protein